MSENFESAIDELLAKFRDCLQAFEELRQMIDRYLSRKVEVLEQVEKKAYDVSKITWQQTEGPSGMYEKAQKQETLDYACLLKDLNEHQGKMAIEGRFYWLFTDGQTVGRKSAKK